MSQTSTGYYVTLSDGTTLGGDNGLVYDVSQVTDGSLADTGKASISLIRRGARAYSDILAADMLHMLENFSNSQAPANPLVGQLWFDQSSQVLRLYNNGSWSQVGGGTATGLTNAQQIGVSGDASGSASFDGTAACIIPLTLATMPGLAAGTYSYPTITVDTKGRITGVQSNAAPPSTSGYAIDADVVHKAGDTMTGSLTITGSGNNLNVQNGLVEQGGNALVPAGVIVMWTGSTAPAGWVLCDGGNGTPNLSGKFVVMIGNNGAGDGYNYGDQGGSDHLSVGTDNQGSHSHSITTDQQGDHSHGGSTGGFTLTTNELPAHSHDQRYLNGDGVTQSMPSTTTSYPANETYADGAQRGLRATSWDSTDSASIQPTGSGASHSHSISTDGQHQHGGTTNNTGGHTHTVSFDNRPVYYALAYIMKT